MCSCLVPIPHLLKKKWFGKSGSFTAGGSCSLTTRLTMLYNNNSSRVCTFLWKVPSSAATMIVFPSFAMSSQNSTMSGNWEERNRWDVTEPKEQAFVLTNCPSSIPMTPYFFAVFLIEVRSLVEVAAVNCLNVERGGEGRGGEVVCTMRSEYLVIIQVNLCRASVEKKKNKCLKPVPSVETMCLIWNKRKLKATAVAGKLKRETCNCGTTAKSPTSHFCLTSHRMSLKYLHKSQNSLVPQDYTRHAKWQNLYNSICTMSTPLCVH